MGSSFYFIAIIYAIVHDAMDKKRMSTPVQLECAQIDYQIPEYTNFYNEDRKNLFVFIMLVDLVLFGELFGSHNIMLNPIYWLGNCVWNAKKSLTWVIASLFFTFGSIVLFVVLSLKYDMGTL